MATFNHFVITRFNLKQTIWAKDKRGFNVNDLTWLQNRYALFESYCFSSMQAQTCTNFKWLVYFDKDTPSEFKTKNDVLRAVFPNFEPKYVSSFSEFESQLPLHINAHCTQDYDYVLTTRLDNDDSFHRDAIKVIQQHFKPRDKTIIDLKNGLALQIFDGYKLSLKPLTTSGPFITLIEHLDTEKQVLTVYDRAHLDWIKDATFIDIENGYYWLQIIHERNISNTLSTTLSFNKAYLIGFPFNKAVKFSLRYCTFILLEQLKIITFFKRFKPKSYLVFI